jgi:hypothetical protein
VTFGGMVAPLGPPGRAVGVVAVIAVSVDVALKQELDSLFPMQEVGQGLELAVVTPYLLNHKI